METLTIKNPEVTKVIKYFKQNLSNLLVQSKINKSNLYEESKKEFPFDFLLNEVTIIHIIYNRLRRGIRKPHMINAEIENEYLKKNEYAFSRINKKLVEKKLEVISFEDVYNAK